MTSLKSKIFNFLIRNRHLFRGKLKKETFDFNTSIADFRKRADKGGSRISTIPEGITIKEQEIEGMKCEWLIPDGADPTKISMYVHGGGYVAGSCASHRGMVSKLAINTGIIHLIFEYRLAPEHPFPAALEDSVKIYKWLLSSGFKPENLLIAGESAGGGLCLATLLALKERALLLPVAAVAISPWTDLTCSSDSYKSKNKVSAAPFNSWIVFSKYYAGENERTLPLISPLFGDLKGLPPMLLNCGVHDELYEDGEKFYLKAKDAGVDIRFTAGRNMIHCYPVFAPLFKEATIAMDEILGFIKEKLK